MYDSDVLMYRKIKGDLFALVCETVNGNRFVIKQIINKRDGVLIKLSGETTAKAENISFIKRAHSAREIRKFPLKQ